MRWNAASLLALAFVVMFAFACGDDGAAKHDASVDGVMSDTSADANPNNPQTLMDTGLCVDAACSQINAGIYAYTPRFELWSDSATKKRWIQLPAGQQIDTSDMDFWSFPVGTKLWKEFTRDSVRVETRLVMRIGAGNTNMDWFYGAYLWNAAQDSAPLFDPFAGSPNANGTQHDVPSRPMCRACHDSTQPSRILGFSALQLDFDNGNSSELDLADVIANGWLTAPPPAPGTIGQPYFGPLPGTTYEPPALGYLHANCGHCHNPNSATINNTPMQLRLTVGTLGSLATTPAYLTAVDANAALPIGGRTKIITKAMPDASAMIYRFESTIPSEHMPQLGSEVMDPTGQTTLRTWITNIP